MRARLSLLGLGLAVLLFAAVSALSSRAPERELAAVPVDLTPVKFSPAATGVPVKKHASGPRRSQKIYAPPAGDHRPQYVEGEVLVRFDASASKAERAAARRAVGTVDSSEVGTTGVEVLRLDGSVSEKQAARRLERRRDVAYAGTNGIAYADAAPNDPLYPKQWALDNVGDPTIPGGLAGADISASAAWDRNVNGSSVTIAVMDTGVLYTHPDLAPNMWVNYDEQYGTPNVDDDSNGRIDDIHGWNFGTDSPEALPGGDDNPWHGTAVASVAAAVRNDSVGVTGVSNAKIMALNVFEDGKSPFSNLLAAVEYARKNNANVINASLSAPVDDVAFEQEIAKASDITFVAAAGNTSADVDYEPRFPCAYDLPNIVCVGSTSRVDAKAPTSSFGFANVDLFAPGNNVLALYGPSYANWDRNGDSIPDVDANGYGEVSGTSFSSPAVAGAAALIKAQNPTFTPAQVRARLLDTVDHIPALEGLAISEGRLNLDNALGNITTPRAGGTAVVASGELVITGAADTANDVKVAETTAAFTIEDLRAPLAPSTGCTAVTASKVSCAKTGVTSIRFELGDHANVIDAPVDLPVTINGGSGPDHVRTAGFKSAVINTGGGMDVIVGSAGNDTINSGDARDQVFGGDGADTINSGDGDDLVGGDDGNDTITLGAGNDELDPTRDGGNDVVYGGDGDDNLRGRDGVDQLFGQAGADNVEVSGGTDSLADGGADNDTLVNRGGRQRFVGGDGTDLISYDRSSTPVTINMNGAAVSGVSGENDTVETDVENALGGTGNDTITGNGLANVLNGGYGADTIQGLGGDDTLNASSHDLTNDDYSGGDGVDVVTYEAREYFGVSVSLDGVANDGAVQLGEADQVRADVENVVATDYVDQLTGNAAANRLDGGAGADVLDGRGGTDVFVGGSGYDTVSYAADPVGVDVFVDGVANDGGPGENEYVPSDVEKVVGSAHDDFLSSRIDGTTLEGGAGSDTYVGIDGGQTILARDGAVDNITSCGNGTDIVRRDVGDTATSVTCETNDTAPAATISAGPARGTERTADSTPSFSFSAPHSSGITFRCAVAPGTVAPDPVTTGAACSSPFTATTLADGDHTFAVQAFSGTTPSGLVATRTFTVDTVAAPVPVSRLNPSLTPPSYFTKLPNRLMFMALSESTKCAMDAASLSFCDPVVAFRDLPDGEHVFRAAAREATGLVSPEAELRFVVDSAPTTEILAGPSGVVTDPRPTWTFSTDATDLDAFECRIFPLGTGTGFAWVPCSGATSHQPTTALAAGRYRFEVRAKDDNGAIDRSPSGRSFEVPARWGFVVNQQPTVASHTPASTLQGNSLGGTNTIARTGVGSYNVLFGDLGNALYGNAQVQAYGSTTNRCTAASFSTSSNAARVEVMCRTAAGALADTNFVAQFQTHAQLPSVQAGYLTVFNPTVAAPSLTLGTWANSTGGNNTVSRTAVGRHTATFGGFTGSSGIPVVTTNGTDASACQVWDWTLPGVSVGCFNGSSAASDTTFSVSYVDGRVFTGRRGAYLYADNATSTTAYTPAVGRRWNSQGGVTTSRKTATGAYEVILGSLPAANAIPVVSAVGNTTAVTCRTQSWAASGSNVALQVRCTTLAGVAADAKFTLSYATSVV